MQFANYVHNTVKLFFLIIRIAGLALSIKTSLNGKHNNFMGVMAAVYILAC